MFHTGPPTVKHLEVTTLLPPSPRPTLSEVTLNTAVYHVSARYSLPANKSRDLRCPRHSFANALLLFARVISALSRRPSLILNNDSSSPFAVSFYTLQLYTRDRLTILSYFRICL